MLAEQQAAPPRALPSPIVGGSGGTAQRTRRWLA